MCCESIVEWCENIFGGGWFVYEVGFVYCEIVVIFLKEINLGMGLCLKIGFESLREIEFKDWYIIGYYY